MNQPERPPIPTIRDVARTAGVSLGTVSRVLNHQEPVKPAIRAKVEAAIKALGIPVVLVERAMPAWAHAVMVDHAAAIKQATAHLLKLGHRRIALLTGSPDLFPAHDRIRGYEAAHIAAGVALDPARLRKESFLVDYGYSQTALLMRAKRPPTAIIAGGIDMLPGILRALRERGLKLPHDVPLVAASDADLAQLSEPAISVERWDYASMGKVAAKLALDAIAAAPTKSRAAKPKRVVVPAGFLPRAPCAAPRAWH